MLKRKTVASYCNPMMSDTGKRGTYGAETRTDTEAQMTKLLPTALGST
jgi:hypothetical protein